MKSSVIGITIGVCLFALMVPTLMVAIEDPQAFEMPSFESGDCCEHEEYSHDYSYSPNSSINYNKSNVNKNDQFLLNYYATKGVLNSVGIGSVMPF